ncbi:MAG: phenylalanine--tRNA ligase subunit beta, partial [Clostridia bacterium]
FEPDTSCKEWHPGRCAAIMHGDSRVGMIGQIHPLVCANFGIECDVYAAELDVTALFELRGDEAVYRPLPKFPAAQRDLALVCDRSIPVAHLERCIRENIGHLAESVTLFDVYTGAQVPEDKKSVAYACVM